MVQLFILKMQILLSENSELKLPVIPEGETSLDLNSLWIHSGLSSSADDAFIRKNHSFLHALFSNIPLQITTLKLTNMTDVEPLTPVLRDNLLPRYLKTVYIQHLEIMAGLFSKLPSGIIEIDLSSLPFYLLPKDSLKIMRGSLPFIKNVYISAKVINNMTKATLDQFCEIFPNANSYELADKYSYEKVILRTPKLTYLLNKPKKAMQLTHYACNLLLQQKELPARIVFHITSFLDLFDEIDIKQTMMFRRNNVNASCVRAILKETNPFNVKSVPLPYYSKLEDNFFQLNAYFNLVAGLLLVCFALSGLYHTYNKYSAMTLVVIDLGFECIGIVVLAGIFINALNFFNNYWELDNARGQFTYTEMQDLSLSLFKQEKVNSSNDYGLLAMKNSCGSQITQISDSFFYKNKSFYFWDSEESDIENQIKYRNKKIN